MVSRRWWIALAAFCLLLVIAVLPVLRAPFGDNRDGVNGGTWALASREIREHPGASKLGAYAPHRVPRTYVNHPPLIVAELAVVESVLGAHRWTTRLPALVATLAAIVLTALLLVEAGIAPPVAVTGTVLGFGCPLVRTYGAMVDTPIVGLPLGIATLLLWQRARAGRRVPPAMWVGIVALTCLTSWLGWLLAGLVGIGLLVGRRWADAAAAAGGAALGATGYVAWIWQAEGSARPVVDIFLERSGDPGATGVGFAQPVWHNIQSGFLPWTALLALPLAAIALRDRRLRAIACVAWVTAIAWEAIFPFRAATEEFWLWWSVVPLAVGFGAGLDALLRLTHGRGVGDRPATRFMLPALCGLGMLSTLAPSPGGTTWHDGVGAGTLVAAAAYPADQQRAWVFSSDVDNLGWLGYGTRRDMAAVTEADVPALAIERPRDLVLTPTERPGSRRGLPPRGCLRPGEGAGTYALVTATRLASLVAVAPSCP
jgi:hypothetical protein